MERPPVTVVLGHIDHGKSTLLDYIRKTKIAEDEAGGITQEVKAYEITHHDKHITFIDTPGHEAFSSMREHGAAAADIAILVVSAEDGVKSQTLEAKIAIEKNYLPYLVAISKIDKPNANPERVKQNLLENGILLEGLGGPVPWVTISAKTGEGISELLDLLLILAEVTGLKKDDDSPASGSANGFILEARIDSKKGIVADAIVRSGTLRRGDYLTLNSECFRIRKLENFLCQDVVELSAGRPAVIYGWNAVPAAGARWHSSKDKTEGSPLQIPKDYPQKPLAEDSNEIIVPLVIKTDTLGTLAAIKKEIQKLLVPSIKIQILAAGVGAITENDAKLASADRDIIVVGFNVKIEPAAKNLAVKHKITQATFDIIYKLSEWLEAELDKRRPIVETKMVLGTVKIIKLFSQTKDKQIVGGLVLDGRIAAGRSASIKRRESLLGEGEILELRERQTKINEVEKGKQFGALVRSRHFLAPGDLLEIFQIEKK
ncbi:MAG: GTP-binding protein [Candidatus Vogelbacteria bacterium]|nr:GTP-binding protein [Candidatus Vogelbacteria bacterium]